MTPVEQQNARQNAGGCLVLMAIVVFFASVHSCIVVDRIDERLGRIETNLKERAR